MDKILAIWNDVYSFFREKWLYFAIGAGVIVIVIGVWIVLKLVEYAEEDSLKTKFDTAYFLYLNSSANKRNVEQSFQNFFSTLVEISDTKKNYKIVNIADIILGDIYFNEGKSYETALSYYSRATNSSSEFLRVVAIFNVAQTYETIGKVNEAIDNYRVIIDRYPNSFLAPISVIRSAQIYNYIGDVQKAKEMYSLMTNRYSDSFSVVISDLLDLVINQR